MKLWALAEVVWATPTQRHLMACISLLSIQEHRRVAALLACPMQRCGAMYTCGFEDLWHQSARESNIVACTRAQAIRVQVQLQSMHTVNVHAGMPMRRACVSHDHMGRRKARHAALRLACTCHSLVKCRPPPHVRRRLTCLVVVSCMQVH